MEFEFKEPQTHLELSEGKIGDGWELVPAVVPTKASSPSHGYIGIMLLGILIFSYRTAHFYTDSYLLSAIFITDIEKGS